MKKKIKSNKLGRFIAIPYNMFESPAFKDLSSSAVSVLLLLKYRFNGSNNGEISLSCREVAAWCGMSKGTASIKFKELYLHGFIKPSIKGKFTIRLATTWILTFERSINGEPKTDDWKRYDRNQKKVPNIERYNAII